jgi:hypothetical protein
VSVPIATGVFVVILHNITSRQVFDELVILKKSCMQLVYEIFHIDEAEFCCPIAGYALVSNEITLK